MKDQKLTLEGEPLEEGRCPQCGSRNIRCLECGYELTTGVPGDTVGRRMTQREINEERAKEGVWLAQRGLDRASQALTPVSQEVQGRGAQNILYDWLEINYPNYLVDNIGVPFKRGSDIILNLAQQGESPFCLLFESKDTKNYEKGWAEKLKGDTSNVGARLGILVCFNSNSFVTGQDPSRLVSLDNNQGALWAVMFNELPKYLDCLIISSLRSGREQEFSKQVGSLGEALAHPIVKQSLKEILDGSYEWERTLDSWEEKEIKEIKIKYTLWRTQTVCNIKAASRNLLSVISDSSFVPQSIKQVKGPRRGKSNTSLLRQVAKLKAEGTEIILGEAIGGCQEEE